MESLYVLIWQILLSRKSLLKEFFLSSLIFWHSFRQGYNCSKGCCIMYQKLTHYNYSKGVKSVLWFSIIQQWRPMIWIKRSESKQVTGWAETTCSIFLLYSVALMGLRKNLHIFINHCCSRLHKKQSARLDRQWIKTSLGTVSY